MNDPRSLRELVLVAAVAQNGVIGRGNALPWKIPGELKHFRSVTVGHSVIMGRKTFDSIGKPLADRRNIVLTRDEETRRDGIEGCEVVATWDEAIALARTTDDAPRVIGGSQVYATALPWATELLLTEIAQDFEGDAFFPRWDASEFVEVSRVAHSEPGVSFARYRRRGLATP